MWGKHSMPIYFHVGRRSDLTELKPSRFDINGTMREKAVFVTTEEHIRGWAIYIRDAKFDQPLFLYRVEVADDARIEDGCDGRERGDLKVVTDMPLPCEFVREV